MRVLRPKSLAEALESYRQEPEFLLLAGGSDIAPALSKERPVAGLIEIGRLEALCGISEADGAVTIGALTTVSELLESPVIREHFPLLIDACRSFGSKQIRNVATLGGNIGNASPAGDLLPPLLVKEAQLRLLSADGERTLTVTELFGGYKELNLGKGEMIASVTLPIEEGWTSYYRKVGRRNALNIAVASLAALVRRDGKRIVAVRLGAGAVHPFPRRLKKLEAAIVEAQTPGKERIMAWLKEEIAPRSGLRGSAAYRLEVTANMIMECLHGVE
jgi:CO/xanthine dehydrogenase FAD-binding subunit